MIPVTDARTALANAILRAGHCCIECGEPLSAPVWDEGEWIPDSVHWPWCPVLAGGEALVREWYDIVDALHRAGYGCDYGDPVPAFSSAVT